MSPPSAEPKNKPSKRQSFPCYSLHSRLSLDLLFDPEDGGDMFHRNIGGLHGVISQKTELFTAVRTSNSMQSDK
jgi:hypothetical protein